MEHAHTHTTDKGLIVTCYHKCRTTILSAGFWAGVTLSFPIEHWLWEKVWPFTAITQWMGL